MDEKEFEFWSGMMPLISMSLFVSFFGVNILEKFGIISLLLLALLIGIYTTTIVIIPINKANRICGGITKK